MKITKCCWLQIKAWAMRGSKDPNEKEEKNKNNNFDENYKKTAGCNVI